MVFLGTPVSFTINKWLDSLDTRLNTFVFLYIACCLYNFIVLAESSLVLNFHTRCLLLVFTKQLNNHKRIQQCCHLANLESTIMT